MKRKTVGLKWVKNEREYIVIMYQVKKKKDLALEKDLDRVIKKHKFKFTGSGYDFTNKRYDIEYRR